MSAMDMIGAMQGQGPAGVSGKKQMGQEDFLRLMITQLQNQDPMKPMENGDFLGQMAQFSTVSGIENLNNTMSSVTGALSANQALQAASLVERSALVAADSIEVSEGDGISGVIELPEDVEHGVVTIRDANGQEVARIAVENDGTGLARFEWGGSGADDEPGVAGQYEVSAEYQSGGNKESVATYLWGEIESVSLFGGTDGMRMTLKGIGTLSLAEAREIS